MTDEAVNNAVECVDCDALGPVRPTISEAGRAASAEGWARSYDPEGSETIWRCPTCRRRPPPPNAGRTDDRVVVTLRLAPALRDRLRAEADDRDLSLNRLASALLTEGLDHLIPTDELRASMTRRTP